MSFVLVCGGAGYTGAHMCKLLARVGRTPVALDNLSTGHRQATRWGPLLEDDLLDPDALAGAFRSYRSDVVMRFAARSLASFLMNASKSRPATRATHAAQEPLARTRMKPEGV